MHGHKNDLASCSLGHLLQSFELTDLHGRGRGEDVSCLTHEPYGVDLGAGGNDLAFSEALLLCGAGERRGYFGGEDDVFDEDALDRDTPLVRDVSDNLGDLETDCLTFSDDRLDSARAA